MISIKPQSGAVFADRYQVIEELGVGGMGSVYRVLDKKLGEEIALKLIKPEIAADRDAIERFSAELKLARQVVHKNVARMFDLNEVKGIPYITMEYVRGENLSRLIQKVSRLFPGQAIPIACQICEGLAEAHRLGILHRDLKPQNVMIDEDGRAKIMDFGLARLLTFEDKPIRGGTPGTPAYVSPEQCQGRPLDTRSDLYSLGVLMYEILTGTTPFKATNALDLVRKHVSEKPREPREINPGISVELSRVVMKCLEKNPDKRFQSAAEVRQALDELRIPAQHLRPGQVAPRRWLKWAGIAVVAALAVAGAFLVVKPAPPPFRSTVAVLPVTDTGRADAGRRLREAIQTKLSSIPDLTVLPQLTVDSVKTTGKNPRTIGRLLKADYLLQLSLREEGSLIGFKADLINSQRGDPASTYEVVRKAGSFSAASDDFARDLASVLGDDISEDRLHGAAGGLTSNLDARILYQQGNELITKAFSKDNESGVFEAAVGKFLKAVELDPDYALALWAIGNAYEGRYHNTERDKRNPGDLDTMYTFYYRAYYKNTDSPETNIGLGWTHFNKGEFTLSFRFFKNALELEPRSAVVNLDAGAFLRSIGLYKRALNYLRRAAKLDPLDSNPHEQISQCLMYLGRFDEAAAESNTAISLEARDARPRHLHALHLILAGRLEEGDKEIAAIRDIDPKYEYLPVAEALLAAARGEKDKALAFKGDTEILPIQGTCFYILLGMPDAAVANIQEGIDKGFEKTGMYLYTYPSLIKNPCLKNLRGLPRFQSILKKQKERYLKELQVFEDL